MNATSTYICLIYIPQQLKGSTRISFYKEDSVLKTSFSTNGSQRSWQRGATVTMRSRVQTLPPGGRFSALIRKPGRAGLVGFRQKAGLVHKKRLFSQLFNYFVPKLKMINKNIHYISFVRKSWSVEDQ